MDEEKQTLELNFINKLWKCSYNMQNLQGHRTIPPQYYIQQWQRML